MPAVAATWTATALMRRSTAVRVMPWRAPTVARQDLAGAAVRVRWTVAEEDRGAVDRDAIQRALAGAAETKLEGRIVPVVRTRMAGISRMPRLEDKVRAWSQVAEVNVEPLLECLAALQEAGPEDIAAGVLRETDAEQEEPAPLSLAA